SRSPSSPPSPRPSAASTLSPYTTLFRSGDAEQVLYSFTQMHLAERDVIVFVSEQFGIFRELFHIDIIRYDTHADDCPDYTVGVFFHQGDEKGAEVRLHFLGHFADHPEVHESDGFSGQYINVARMRVPMEESFYKNLMEDGICHAFGENRAGIAECIDGFEV